MTKEQFKACALTLIEQAISLPDEIWETCYPTLSSTAREKDTGILFKITVGIDVVNPDD